MSDDSRLALLPTAEDYYKSLIEQILHATDRISMLYFAFCNGYWGKQITDSLIAAAKRGVAVEVYVSIIGAFTEDIWEIPSNFALYTRLRKNGVTVYFIPDFRNGRSVHVKIAAIDNHTAYIGGSNIHDHYTTWTDTNFLCHAPRDISGLHSLIRETATDLSVASDPVMIDAHTRIHIQTAKNHLFESELLRLITSAKKHIHIVTWYLFPSEKIMTALHDARIRGVNISIMYSQSNRMPILTPIRMYYVKKLNAMGVKLYPWIQKYNHSKLYWNESTAIIGSPNLDIFSLYVWYESLLLGKNAALVDLLDDRWAQLLDGTSRD